MKISHMTGKLDGLQAINTSPLDNDFCARQQAKKNTVCKHCYSVKQLTGRRKNCRAGWNANGELLSVALPVEYLRYVAGQLNPPSGLVRFNGHGELINRHHAANLFQIAGARPDLMFALWTKRRALVRGLVVPDNLVLVYSEPRLNHGMNSEPPAGFDKVFCVLSDSGVSKSNCDRKNCQECRLCYDKGGPRVIVEVLK